MCLSVHRFLTTIPSAAETSVQQDDDVGIPSPPHHTAVLHAPPDDLHEDLHGDLQGGSLGGSEAMESPLLVDSSSPSISKSYAGRRPSAIVVASQGSPGQPALLALRRNSQPAPSSGRFMNS